MKINTILLIIIFLVLSVSLKAQYKIIVNSQNSTTSISKHDISQYFLKKRIKWTNGVTVAPVDLEAKSYVRKSFSEQIHGRTVAQIRAYWQQSVFAGKDTPPREIDSDVAVIEFVKTNIGAIGYVSAGANTAGVNVITIK